jgi:methenyltetrahydromethanopterin cyclohydrolase
MCSERNQQLPKDEVTFGPQVPSSSSRDYGEPFAAIFARYNNDFYAVDPHRFSPAEVVFQNIETGVMHAFGETNHEVFARSFTT